ncbi:MAG: SDR family oxidoreductase [Francisellaceae bacterium]
MNLKDKVVFVSGASRGVGKAIAIRAAKDGAHVIITGKTDKPHPKLPGTLFSAAEEIKAAGAASVTPVICDVRDLEHVEQAIKSTGDRFGRIDVLVNNASALYLQPIDMLTEKHFNLMHEVIVRASLFSVKYALPYLLKSGLKQVLNIAPKADIVGKWFANHTAYTLCKFSSSMLVTGLAEELKDSGIHINGLWPATLLNTAAVKFVLGGDEMLKHTRDPMIMADAAYEIVANKTVSGEFFLDALVVKSIGIDPDSYATAIGIEPYIDLYVEEALLN